ncbi:MAG: HEPN domain-containing protein [Armatimonadetes bacterium]|nr:HEPN domain-containing protein [Armatimonadota bacterium]
MTNEIKQHLERSEHFIKVAQDLAKLNYWEDVISRSYFSMFHSATAILLDINIQRSSHHALISAFGEYVAKKDLIDRKFHRYLLDAFSARNESDYLPIIDSTEEEAFSMINKAKELLKAVNEYLEKNE